ncbi:hypothetical protein GA0115240_105814 [Streptomyces sp. DvalAA-14]|uniref:hypothetical protein n=1 Tax=unclassified Streptomyces TaxID=2593676 RepID=UPI00081AFF3B|nr:MULTISPECIES: hypothetical protein [unclassified Streptomyces]MYS19163.1 hypothetical protein [Streptomyces sp. SID4948]SCD38133.1 hypothetical protein GA0115240_105814 [Streptomyces sp. DvalAA-14]
MKLSQAQLQMYAAAAGAGNPALAAAVAMAESRGETSAHNTTGLDDSYGPWQINMKGDLGPARRKQFGITSNSQLFDVKTNAHAMVIVSNGGTDFSAWSTFTNGDYEKYYSGAPAGTAQSANFWDDVKDPFNLIIPGEPFLKDLVTGGNPVAGLGDSITGTYGFIKSTAEWLSKASNWVRISYVIGGGALVIAGLVMVVRDQELKQISGMAGKALRGKIGGKGSTA